jgi:predicted aldo/keto reductase-like oxidoreductase
VRCSDCATCAVRCPNHVAVAARLTRAQELLA